MVEDGTGEVGAAERCGGWAKPEAAAPGARPARVGMACSRFQKKRNPRRESKGGAQERRPDVLTGWAGWSVGAEDGWGWSVRRIHFRPEVRFSGPSELRLANAGPARPVLGSSRVQAISWCEWAAGCLWSVVERWWSVVEALME